MFEFFQSGGIFMYVILFVSTMALAIFSERAIYLYLRLRHNLNKIYDEVLRPLEKGDYQRALSVCCKYENLPMGRILKSGLTSAGKRDKEIEQTLQQSIMREIPKLKTRVNYLSLFANIATLLGLLGTIVGLMAAFSGVSTAAASEKQEILATGISIAMNTTAFGLIVSIPCLIGFYLLNNRGDFLIDTMDEKALGLANMLASLKRRQADGQ